MAEQRAREWLTTRPAPEQPDWYREILRTSEGPVAWNGKVYARGRIYLGGREIHMTPEQEKEFRAYQDQRRKWRAATVEIEAGVVKA